MIQSYLLRAADFSLSSVRKLLIFSSLILLVEASVWAQVLELPAASQTQPATPSATATITLEQIEQKKGELSSQKETIQKNLDELLTGIEGAQKQVEALQSKADADGKLSVELSEQLDKAQTALSAARDKAPADLLDRFRQQVQLLERISLLFDQQRGALDLAKSLRSTLAQVKDNIESVRVNGPSEEPPYSFVLLDALRTEISLQKEKNQTLSESLKAAQAQKEQAQSGLESKSAALQLLRESIGGNQSDSASKLDAARLSVAISERRLAQETIALRDLEIVNQKLQLQIGEAQLKLLQTREDWIEPEAVFREQDLQEQLKRLGEDDKRLEEALPGLQDQLNKAEIQLAADRRRLADETSPLHQEAEETSRIARDKIQREIKSSAERRERIKDRREFWRRRFDVFNGQASVEEFGGWLQDARVRSAALQSEFERRRDEIVTESRKRNTLESRVEEMQDQPALKKELQKQLKNQLDYIKVMSTNMTDLELSRRLVEKLIVDLQNEVDVLSFQDYAAIAWNWTNATLDKPVWTQEILNEDGVKEIIAVMTVRKLVFAVLYFVAGLVLARLLARSLARHLLRRFGVHEGAALALQKLAYYGLLLAVIVFTLNAIQFPLTAFAFLGGALAIGVGFGSQNLLNNFISGLLLLMERPIRVGDMITVEGTTGRVISIGARCTQVLTFDNIDLLIPNSKLLENSVINLTLGDQQIRTTVSVGVAYGSNARDVSRLIRKAVDEHGQILNQPEPFVIFEDFGDSSLIFTVYFWVLINDRNSKMVIRSSIRHRIYNLFEEAGIVISFPQRDVHIDSLGPLDVRVLPQEPTTNKDA
ncbi:MAG: mechanosensitive ion channel [Candidatus Hinthialibacter antarcticus]|nr:mechanosensitive ion channel [Candidatus Hinthialibacter antarcticus]